MRPRRVPQEQLHDGAHPDADNELYGLRPGEVVLTTGDQLAGDVPTKNRSGLILVAICPIFDETGQFFGINVIELDLRRRLTELLGSSTHDELDVYVTDRMGNIALSFSDGVPVEFPERQSIVELYPELQAALQDGVTQSTPTDSDRVHMSWVRLGSSSSSVRLAVVVASRDAKSRLASNAP